MGHRNARARTSNSGDAFKGGNSDNRRWRLLVAFIVVLAGVIVLPATAVSDQVPSGVNIPDAAFERAVKDGQYPADIDSTAADGLPVEHLDRSDVITLLDALFEEPLEGPVGPFENLEVDQFLSRNVAVLSHPSGAEQPSLSDYIPVAEPVLISSSFPLTTDGLDLDPQPVDLSLEAAQGAISPVNPLTEVEIPEALGEGIDLPESGISIELQGAPEGRAPSILNGTGAVYPNVAEETDLTVVPAPNGIETFTSIRSPEAPRSQTFALDLPAGADLQADGRGAKAVVGGETLLRVSAPVAIDAGDRDVPVVMSVSDSAITLTVSPDENTVWPILVDPLFETYSWGTTSCSGLNYDWKATSTTGPLTTPWLVNESGTLTCGMYLKAAAGSYKFGDKNQWAYSVPRLEQEEQHGTLPESHIVRLTLSPMRYSTSAGPGSPYLITGIWDSTLNNWAGKEGSPSPLAVRAYAGNSGSFNGKYLALENGEPGKRDGKAQQALFAMWSNENVSLAASREAVVGGATVELGDTDLPSVSAESSVTPWVNASSAPLISVNASDRGLGVKSLRFGLPAAPIVVTNPCLGTAWNPCPSQWQASVGPGHYDPSKLAQGIVDVPVTGIDVVGSETPAANSAHVYVRIDHTKPTLALSGTLTEQSVFGTNLPKYTLKYSATDGDSASVEALSSFGGAGTAPGKTELPDGVAVEASGNVLVLDRANKRVMRYDKNGVFLNQFGTAGTGAGQFNDPMSIAVSAAGNIWVAEVANARVQEFSAAGVYMRQITCACFSQPYAIAAGPNQAIWVADIGNDKLYKYNESGTQLVVAHGIAGNPSSASTEMTNVTGLATDAAGNVWAAEFIMNKLIKFDSSGTYASRITPPSGSGDGQFVNPSHVAVAPSGHLMVVDYSNNRLQEIKTDGTFVRKFGSKGAGSGQMNAPQQPAFAPDGTLYVPDYLNHRVNRWAHADYNPQSGVASTEVLVDGVLTESKDKDVPACAGQDSCASSKEWTLNADKYAVGQHTVKVVATDGVNLPESKPITVQTHGDLKAPAIALSGSMTEQASLGTTLPSYKLKVVATDPGSLEERKSGVASVTIKVDGNSVDSTSPGCPAGDCSITREWTFDSTKYPGGWHTATVTATDAAERTETKSAPFFLAKDKTPPTFTGASAFYNAPEGWVEQKSYAINATGFDPGGSGVTSMQLKIDGQTVKSKTQACSEGDCSLMLGLGQTLNMSAYEGGSHPAELIVADGAGNTANKTWTINVDPSGAITPEEVDSTLEAVEATEPEAIIVASSQKVNEPALIEVGSDPKLVEAGGDVRSSGTPTDTAIESATGEISIEGADGLLELKPTEGAPSEEPVVVGDAAAVITAEDATETIIRPLYNGALAFSTIREPIGPEDFAWKVTLQPGHELRAIDDDHAEVVTEYGRAFLVSTQPAHDATGKPVPTRISVDGDEIILTVEHHGGNFVYPVIAGQAYETGYSSVIEIDPVEEAEEQDDVEEEESDPLSFEELEEIKEFNRNPLWGKNSFTKKQIKRLVRPYRPIVKVSAPTFDPGKFLASKREYRLITKVCAIDGCNIWWVEAYEGTYTRWGTNQKNTRVEYNGTKPNCGSAVNVVLQPLLKIHIFAEDIHLPPSEAWYGEGKHLTYYCKYNIEMSGHVPYPGIPGGIKFAREDTRSLQTWVYHNGFQSIHTRNTECPPFEDFCHLEA